MKRIARVVKCKSQEDLKALKPTLRQKAEKIAEKLSKSEVRTNTVEGATDFNIQLVFEDTKDNFKEVESAINKAYKTACKKYEAEII